MTSFRNRLVFACLSIVGTAGLVSFSNPAAASTGEFRRATIVSADLNFAASAGHATFERRAADLVCRPVSREAAGVEIACRRDAGITDVASN